VTASAPSTTESPFARNATSSNRAGMTLMNDQVGEVIAQVMKDKPGVTITYLPSMIRVDGDQRTDFVYDEFAEALGEEPGSFTSADLEESMSTHYGRMIHEDDRTIMFANPEDAAEYIGFDLKPLATADVPQARSSAE
jgi:propane monooxygenase coupling protein